LSPFEPVGPDSTGLPASLILSSPPTGQLAPGSGTLFYLFTAASNPTVVVNGIPGASLFSSGTIYLPDGSYNISATFSAACVTNTVGVSGILTLYSNDYDIGFNALLYGEAAQFLNYTTGFYQVYQNLSDLMWNTYVNGNDLNFTTGMSYGGGVNCICNYSVIITALVGPNLVSVATIPRVVSHRKNTEVERKTDRESIRYVSTNARGFTSPSITISDDDYIRVSPQTASISISSAKRDVILSSGDFSD